MAESGDKRPSATSSLEQLKKFSVVVADTGDFEQIKCYLPQDSTTNPSLLLQASQLAPYAHLMDDAIEVGVKSGMSGDALIDGVCDQLAVNFGIEILKLVPGVVSTEVDASLSFDAEASEKRARQLIERYEAAGIDKGRVLIKMATTWEGCQAARALEKDGIHCNMTLLFSKAQAIAAAEAGATLISPFVGRILDWHKKNNSDSLKIETGSDDPGVKSVREIYKYYKQYGYGTTVMGASFRNIGEITALAGCDKLTISPALLEELSASEDEITCQLSAAQKGKENRPTPLTESAFRWLLNEDAMATEKLAEGIRNFNKDLIKLKAVISSRTSKQ